jgi:Rieske Fe-S protein
MAADSNPCSTCINRRSVLKSGAACVVMAALSEGCATSEPLGEPFGVAGGGEGGTSGAGGSVGGSGGDDAGSAGAQGDAGASGQGGGSAGTGGSTGRVDSGTADARGEGGAGGQAGTGGSKGAGGGGQGGAGGSQAACSGALGAGKASAVFVGSLVAVANSYVIGRDNSGLYAMSSICTHQGCGTSIVGAAANETLYCACHGSAFSGTGAVTHGPARSALQHFQLEISATGDLTICVNSSVPATTRTPG